MKGIGIAIAMATVSISAFAATNILSSSGSGNRNAFSMSQYWIDLATNTQCPEGALVSTNDYEVRSGQIYTTSASSGNVVFGGRSLTVGTSSTACNIRSYAYSNATLVFNAPGLFLVNGILYLQSGNNYTFRLNGVVTFNSTEDKPFVIQPAYSNNTLVVNAEVHGADTASFKVYGPAKLAPFNVKIAGDASGYAGKITVDTAYESILDNGTIPAALTLPSVSLKELEIKPNTVVRPASSAATITADAITLSAGSHLAVSATVSSSSTAASMYVARESLSLPESGTVHLRCPPALHAPDGAIHAVPVMRAPAGTIDKDKFAITGDSVAMTYDYELSVSTDGDVDTLYIRSTDGNAILQTVGDPGDTSANNDSNTYGSSFTNAAHWSDNRLPHDDADYLVTKINGASTSLRTTYDVNSGEITFGGRSLTIDTDCQLATFVPYLTISRLRLNNGARLAQGQWSPNLNLIGEELFIPSGSVYFETFDTHTMHLQIPITGAGQIVIRGFSSTSSPAGNTVFSVPNPAFTGTVHLTSRWANTMNYHPLVSAQKWQTLKVTSPSALGASLASFNPEALKIDTSGELIVPETMTFADTTRGIHLGNRAQIRIPSGKTATFLSRLTFAGETFIRQSGTLALGGDVRFGSGELPQPGLNRLTFAEGGSLKALSAGCIDGVAVAFSNETSRLILNADAADPDLLANGVRNVKTDTPFVYPGDALKVDFALAGNQPLDSSRSHRLGIATVSATAAAALRNHIDFSLPKSVGGAGARKTLRDVADPETGSVTFYLEVQPCGFSVILR